MADNQEKKSKRSTKIFSWITGYGKDGRYVLLY